MLLHCITYIVRLKLHCFSRSWTKVGRSEVWNTRAENESHSCPGWIYKLKWKETFCPMCQVMTVKHLFLILKLNVCVCVAAAESYGWGETLKIFPDICKSVCWVGWLFATCYFTSVYAHDTYKHWFKISTRPPSLSFRGTQQDWAQSLLFRGQQRL